MSAYHLTIRGKHPGTIARDLSRYPSMAPFVAPAWRKHRGNGHAQAP